MSYFISNIDVLQLRVPQFFTMKFLELETLNEIQYSSEIYSNYQIMMNKFRSYEYFPIFAQSRNLELTILNIFSDMSVLESIKATSDQWIKFNNKWNSHIFREAIKSFGLSRLLSSEESILVIQEKYILKPIHDS